MVTDGCRNNAMQAQLDFFEHTIHLLNELTNERLLLHVYEYHHFLIEYARNNQLRPNLAVELVWRAHLLSPVEYAKVRIAFSHSKLGIPTY